MKFIVAPDSFKESLSGPQAAKAMATGIRNVFPEATVYSLPIADGGEGTCEVITNALGGRILQTLVTGPLGKATTAKFGFIAESQTAVIEVAEVIGIHLITPSERDIWRSSSTGVGELLQKTLEMGASRIILGLGGTVTNDGGVGMMSALGVHALDSAGNRISPTPLGLRKCTSVDPSRLDPRWKNVEILIASDVTSPATGPNGATYVFGTQKGAKSEDLPVLESAITNWVTALEENSPNEIRSSPGVGAAGALALGLFAYFNVSVESGADLILDLVAFADHCDEDAIVFTGEGKIDYQTRYGKGPARVAELSKQKSAQVFAFGGLIDQSASELIPELFDAVVPITRSIGDLEKAFLSAETNLVEASTMLCQVIQACENRANVEKGTSC